jgi:cholesterol 25-hydroxylase
MATPETMVDLAVLSGSVVNATAIDGTSGALKNFTPGLFEAETGEFRLLQPIWDLRLGREYYVSSPLFPIIVCVSFYFASNIPFTIFDLFGADWTWIQKYKIQPNRVVTWPAVRNAISLTVWNQILYILPVSVAQWVWTPPTELPVLAPGLWEFCWQQYAALAIFDAAYFFWHWSHHRVRWLYRHVHSVHHHYSSPSSWVTQYLHPYELITVGIVTTTSPWFFNTHPMTQWSFMLWSIIVSVDAHIGYDLPLLPHNWAPFWGGSIKHDMHHQRPLTNYQPFFNWWDRIFGTECPGQRAGGYRPKALVDWEKNQRQLRKMARGAATDDDVYLKHLGNYGPDEPIMEAKRL